MNYSMNPHLLRIAPVCALLVVTVTGCHTLPDVSQFSDATTQLYVTVQTAGQSAQAEQALIQKTRADGKSRDNSAAIGKGWQSATDAAKAVAEYSDSLRALVESGKQGKAAATKALQSVDTLVKSVAKAYPGGDAGSTVLDGAFQGLSTLYGAVAQDVAAKKLAGMIQKADPCVQNIAEGLAKQFLGLAYILRSSKLVLLYQVEEKYTAHVQSLNMYDGVRTNLLAEATAGGELTTNASLLERWQWAEKMVQAERQQPWYVEYTAAKASINARLDAEIAVVQKASGVINAWGASHKDLVKAVKENRTPNFAVLMVLSQDLLTTYEQTRAKAQQVQTQTGAN